MPLEDGVKVWLSQNNLEYTGKVIETACYRLRMMYAQITGHHNKSRAVPRSHKANFTNIWHQLDAIRDLRVDMESEEDAICDEADADPINLAIEDGNLVDLISDDDEIMSHEALFGDTPLEHAPRRRLTGKRAGHDHKVA